MAKHKKNTIRFVDSFSLKPQITPEVKDFYQSGPEIHQSVRIRVAATHAGKITKNNGFYLPHRMRDGAKSFTAQYKKPIQVHHETHQDPVGRVVSARYVDISGGIADSIKDSIKHSVLDAFVQGNMQDREIIDYACSHFIHDEAISEDPDFEGLGYIELIADITDPDAVAKVLDGRYLTGSVGASTDSAVCSVCKQDWAGDDGRCEHIPGRVYDKKKCVMVAGDLQYDEWSFVNRPADTHSSVIEVNVGGIQDSVKIEENSSRTLPEIYMTVIKDTEVEKPQKTKEAVSMLFKHALDRVMKDEFFKDLPGIEDAIKAVLDNKDLDDELRERELERCVSDALGKISEYDEALKSRKTKEDTSFKESDVADAADNKEEITDDVIDPVKQFFGDEYERIVGEDAWGHEYAEMLHCLLDNVTDEEREANEKLIQEAKMSAEERQALADSSFCGEDRSFPIVDQTHYMAALKLLDRYQGPQDKGRLKECIDRKGKRLKASNPSTGDFTVDYFDRYSDNEVLQMLGGLMKVVDERHLDFKSKETETVQDIEKIEELTQELAKTQDRLNSAQKEARYLHEDIDQLNNALADSMNQVRSLKVEKIVDYRKLSGEELDVKELTDSYKSMSMIDLDASLKDFSGKVDMNKIVDTLNSGLTNKPQGTVADPTLKLREEDKSLRSIKPSDAVLERATEEYLTIRIKDGHFAAERYLHGLKAHGILPQDIKELSKS